MVAINTLPILLMSFIAIAITSTKAGELVIEYNSDNSPPRHPLFSCEIRSSVCRKAGHYTNLNYYPLNLDLFVCHNPILLKALYDYLDFDRKAWGEFVSTYYVTCPPSDKECWIKSQGMNPKLVQKLVQARIDQHTFCFARVSCWDAKDLDKHCYKKQYD